MRDSISYKANKTIPELKSEFAGDIRYLNKFYAENIANVIQNSEHSATVVREVSKSIIKNHKTTFTRAYLRRFHKLKRGKTEAF